MQKIKKITIDPDGFIVLWFETFENRADFIKDAVPAGKVFEQMRFNGEAPYRIVWQLDDFESSFDLAPGIGVVEIMKGTNET